jgi:hypothetical protein
LYYAVGQNKWYAAKQDTTANYWADKARQYYLADSLLSLQYNKELAGGKWDHMMDQVHIGYTYWQQPDNNSMPEVTYISVNKSSGEKQTAAKKGGYISILAAHYSKAVPSSGIKWKTIPDIGKDGDGVTTFPVTASVPVLTNNSPHLQYVINTVDTGVVKLTTCFSPTLNFHNEDGLKYAVSIDDESPQIIVLNKDDSNKQVWSGWVADNIIQKTSYHTISRPGKHIIKYWMISPAVILQKLILDFGRVVRN